MNVLIVQLRFNITLGDRSQCQPQSSVVPVVLRYERSHMLFEDALRHLLIDICCTCSRRRCRNCKMES